MPVWMEGTQHAVWSVSNVGIRKWELQCQPSFYQPGQRQRVDQKNSLYPDFIVKQRNNPQADTQLQFTYTPTLAWHEKLSCIVWSAVRACVGPSFPPQMWGYLTWLDLPWERFKLTCTTFYHRLGMYASPQQWGWMVIMPWGLDCVSELRDTRTQTHMHRCANRYTWLLWLLSVTVQPSSHWNLTAIVAVWQCQKKPQVIHWEVYFWKYFSCIWINSSLISKGLHKVFLHRVLPSSHWNQWEPFYGLQWAVVHLQDGFSSPNIKSCRNACIPRMTIAFML